MIRRLRYFAVGLFLLAPCVARCDDPPTIDNAVLQAIRDALFAPIYDGQGNVSGYLPVWSFHNTSVPEVSGYPSSLADIFGSASYLFGLTQDLQPLATIDIWEVLQRLGYGYISYDTDPPSFYWTSNLEVEDVLRTSDFISSVSEIALSRMSANIFSDSDSPYGLLSVCTLLLPNLVKSLDNLANGNFGGGGTGGGGGSGGCDQTIHIKIHGGVTNIVNILTNHFDRATNHFNVVSNSLTVISNSVTVITNQFDIALDLLHQIASNTQQVVQISILEWMTNDWPSIAYGWPDSSNEVEEVSNLLKVAAYSFKADDGPVVKTRVENDEVKGWIYSRDNFGRYHFDGFADDIDTLDTYIHNDKWGFGEVVTFCLQGILDKSQDIKNSLWILNHSIDTNSVNPDISELDSYKREVDSFVQGTQSSLESVFHNVELDDGVFSRFKSNFVSIFGTVGKGPPMLRGAKGAANRQTVWTFYVGDQQWDISLDSTLYTSSRRLCRMAASMVWCVLLWIAFRKILIRAVYWLVKCIDWSFQVFGFQIKWLGTVEEFLKHIAGIGPGG